MRDRFAKAEFITFVRSTDSLKDLQKLREKHLGTNMYICKNLFYFQVDQYSTFGEKGTFLYFVPLNFGVNHAKEANLKYRMGNLPAEQEALRQKLEESASALARSQEPRKTDIQAMQKRPY